MRQRATRILVPSILTVAFLALTVSGALEAVTRLRVDTPIQATLVGEPDCITAGRYTVGGETYSLALRGYKGSCVAGTPGDTRTVWYDAGDPAVAAPNRRWYLWLAPAVGLLLLTLLGLRTTARVILGRQPVPARRPRPGRRPRVREPRRPQVVAPVRGQLQRKGDEAPYVWDYATQRLGLLIDRAEEADRASLAADERSVEHGLALLRDAHQGLVDGDRPRVEQRLAEAARVMSDSWHHTDLAEEVLAFRRAMLDG